MIGLRLLLLLGGVAGIVLAAALYLREDAPRRARTALLALRVITLALVTLLLLDVVIPGTEPATAGAAEGRWVLVDPDLALLVETAPGEALWSDAVEAAIGEGGRLALATPGTRGPEGIDPAALRLRDPDHPPGDLVEGVARLGESGVDSIVVYSSFRRSAGLLEGLAREALAPLRLERVGGPTRNLGIADLELPERSRAGDSLEGALVLFGEGASAGDSAEVEVRANGRSVVRLTVPVPGGAGERRIPLELPPPPEGDTLVRYTAEARWAGDAFPIDDARIRWVEVGEPEGGILLVSLRPDWEARTLLPVLEAATGLPSEGYLAIGGTERFLEMGAGSEGGGLVGPERFRDRIDRAHLFVLDGAGAGTPEWLRTAARAHPRALHLPFDTAGASIAGIATTNRFETQWVVDADVPPTPVAPFLGGMSLAGLPPLGAVLPLLGPPPGRIVLTARALQSREPLPVLLLREGSDQRAGFALGSGFWRWGTREGTGRQAYRGLWGGVVDWVLAGGARMPGSRVEPADRIVERGAPLRWWVGEEAGGALLTLEPLPLDSTGGWSIDGPFGEAPAIEVGVLLPDPEGMATTPPVSPGLYRFMATRTGEGGEPEAVGSGVVEVEGWAPSLRLPPLDVGEGILAPASGVEGGRGAGGRPLRTHPLPYLLILGLLTAEWIGRRRLGLR